MKADEVFYYVDEFNVSWLPTLRKMWSPQGQQVMIPTPGQPKVHYGLGAVNYHTGETVVLIRKRKRRQEVAELLQTLVDKHPTATIFVVWNNASTHQDREVTHCELFHTLTALLEAAYAFFKRYNQTPEITLSIIGAIPK